MKPNTSAAPFHIETESSLCASADDSEERFESTPVKMQEEAAPRWVRDYEQWLREEVRMACLSAAVIVVVTAIVSIPWLMH